MKIRSDVIQSHVNLLNHSAPFIEVYLLQRLCRDCKLSSRAMEESDN